MKKIIAEIGYNAGKTDDLTLAYTFISEAIKAGAWAVKFQKWDIDAIPEDVKASKRDLKDSWAPTYYEHRKAVEFTIEQLKLLKHETLIQGAEFIVSGKDFNSIKLLAENGFTHIKIPSQLAYDIDIYNYLHKIKEVTVYVSLGMCNEEDYKRCSWNFENAIKFHCHSEYPVPLQNVNLSVLNRYPFQGYSSHEVDAEACSFAMSIPSVEYIERHFTIDKTLKGRDNSTVSSDISEFTKLCKDASNYDMFFKDRERVMTLQEESISEFYKGIV